MDTEKTIERLERIVRERTPQYVSINEPRYDEKLMKTHYLLAKLYEREGNTSEAHDHLRQAEHEFFSMCEVETQKQQYISGGLEEFRKFIEQERKTEKRLEHYRGKLLGIANEIGYNATTLLLTPTSSSPRKDNLVELIKEIA